MTIISVGNFTGKGWDSSITDENHIADSLESLGHTVHRFQRENTREAYWKLPKAEFALIQQWDGYSEDLTERLRMFTKTVVVWSFDFQEWGQEWHERLIKESDLYLSKRIADSKYPNWQWLSQDFAPQFLDKVESGTKDIDVLFTGSYLPWATERNETIKAVGERFNLVIHSVNEWPQGNEGPIMDEGLPELYSRSRVVLSIDHTLEAGYWSDRNAQIMACGAFVLFKYVPLSETVFRNNIAYFYSVEDCLEKLGNLLQPQMIPVREELARMGYDYAQKNLKVRNRVMDLLTIVENYVKSRSV